MSTLTHWVARRYGGQAGLYERFTNSLEVAGMAAIRARLAGDLTGQVLEVGCGTGLNFRHYPPGTAVAAVEPLDDFRRFAAERARTVAARISVSGGDTQALPFADGTFDAVLETLVFCSVPDALAGLREVRRVARPGAPVRFFEHVRSDVGWVARLQDVANPFWSWLSDGCNLNRDTLALIRAAGFSIEQVRIHDLRPARTPRVPMREVHARA